MAQVVKTPAHLKFDDPRYDEANKTYDAGLALKESLELEYLHGTLYEMGQDWEIISQDDDLSERPYLYLEGVRIYADVISTRDSDPTFTIISPKHKEASVLAMLPESLITIAA